MTALRTFPYYGGKERYFCFLLRHLPEPGPNARHFVDVFGGSGVVCANVDYEERTYNDLDVRLVNVFQVLRERPEDLLAQLELTPYSRLEHMNANEPVEPDDYDVLEPDAISVELARRYIVGVAQGFENREAGGWSVTRNQNAKWVVRSLKWAKLPDDLAKVVERLRGIQVEHMDGIDLIGRNDHPGNVLYCDPPYPKETRKSRDAYGSNEMEQVDHERLIETLRGVKQAKVALSSYRTDLYDSLGWRSVEYDKGTGRRAEPRAEVIYMNYDAATGSESILGNG